MKKPCIYRLILCLLIINLIPEQIFAQWSDNFTDGNLTNNPEWIGDTSKFVVNTSFNLQLNSPTTETSAQITTSSDISVKAEWNFRVKLEFNPSSGNYAKIYLMSDTADFTGSVYGYYVRVGYTTDDISLIKQSGLTSTILINGRDKMLNATKIDSRIKVTRDSTGNWALFCDTTANSNYQFLGKAFENSILTSKYFGIQCIFTATRATKFYFDDFNTTGSSYVDPKPYVKPDMYDVVFNELMADPTPPGTLPEYEYIELYNRSEKDFYTENWVLQIGNTSYYLPDTLFSPQSYLVLTSKSAVSAFTKWCKPLGIFTSSSILTNTGQYLSLKDKKGAFISWVEYSDTWYADDFKAEGGWSLERIDPDNPCGEYTNWKAATNKEGGTPGAKNSVFEQNPDVTPPRLQHIQLLSDSIIRLSFNEPLNNDAIITSNYLFGDDNENPASCQFPDNQFKIIDLHLKGSISINKMYTLKIVNSIGDCVSNYISEPIDTFISIPQLTDSSDVVINEVLFNAEPYCPDYIEIYNKSQKILNTSDILLSTDDGTNIKTYKISSNGYLFYPGTYLLLSSDCNKLGQFYKTGSDNTFSTISNLASLDDNTGTIKLKTLDNRIIDIFGYNEQMQMPTLTSAEGVSLERINPEISSLLTSNWHSAAETAGYGTPGFQNSQFLEEPKTIKPLTLDYDVFSPDNDGYNDILSIIYTINDPGTRISIWIFDLSGRKVKQLCNNTLTDMSGSIYWDGISEGGKLSPPGAYLVLGRFTNSNGSSHEYKIPCILAIKK